MLPVIYLYPLLHEGKTFVRISFEQDNHLFRYRCGQQDIIRFSKTYNAWLPIKKGSAAEAKGSY